MIRTKTNSYLNCVQIIIKHMILYNVFSFQIKHIGIFDHLDINFFDHRSYFTGLAFLYISAVRQMFSWTTHKTSNSVNVCNCTVRHPGIYKIIYFIFIDIGRNSKYQYNHKEKKNCWRK